MDSDNTNKNDLAQTMEPIDFSEDEQIQRRRELFRLVNNITSVLLNNNVAPVDLDTKVIVDCAQRLINEIDNRFKKRSLSN